MTTRTFRGTSYNVRKEIGNGKKINGTAGNDWLEVTGSKTTIDTGSGNDYVVIQNGDYRPVSFISFSGNIAS